MPHGDQGRAPLFAIATVQTESRSVGLTQTHDEEVTGAMPITYTNRRGKEYYLHTGKTKTGKDRFYFSTKKQGKLAKTIPDGYEIYESPNAQVFLRRKRPSPIEDAEVQMVRDGIEKYADLKPYEYKVELKKDTITIHVIDQDYKELISMFNSYLIGRKVDEEHMANRYGTFGPMLRFRLVDKENRTFEAERFCFLGSIDDWVPIGSCARLDQLVWRFVRHLGKESFFEILPYGD